MPVRHQECRQSESPRGAHGSGNLWIHRRYESSLNFRSACCRGPHPAAERTLFFYRPRDHLGKCSRSTSTKMQPEIPEFRKEEKCKSSRNSTWFFKGGYSHSTFDCKMISGRESPALCSALGLQKNKTLHAHVQKKRQTMS